MIGFNKISISNTLKEINKSVDRSNIWSSINCFIGLPTIESLESIDVSGTSVESFEGCCLQPNLVSFNCKNTKLSELANLELMSVIVFGDSLTYVNKKVVSPETKDLAVVIREKTRPNLIESWIIVNQYPIRMLNIRNRRRKTVYYEKSRMVPQAVSVAKVSETPIVERELEDLSENVNDKEIRDYIKSIFSSVVQRRKMERNGESPMSIRRMKNNKK